MAYRNRKISGKNLRFESYLGDIEKEMNKQEKKARAKAGRHVRKKLKVKAVQRFGIDSDITKGIGLKNLPRVTLVGVGPPAQAMHLIEFGTDARFTKSGKATGHVKAKPLIIPTLEEEAVTVGQILNKEWF